MTNIIIGDERKMTPLELALRLAGAEYDLRDREEEIEDAKKNGLVIVYGASDDLIEFRGAIEDEDDVYEGGIVAIDKTCNGLFRAHDCGGDMESCPYIKSAIERCKKIEAIWCPEGKNLAWEYKTDIPHSDFIMMEDGEPYCEGIVFSVDDLK